MGRILKKKDPLKKKGQRAEKASDDSSANGENGAPANKPVLAVKKTTPPAKPKVAEIGDGVVQKSLQFLREVKIELKKVTWPSRKQTMGSTLVVIVLVMVIAFFLGIVDFSLSKLIQAVLP
ncbi:MAG: preprotein translocase subunit SecE [Desulfobacteraceae bacterium]|nr:preprotein translocase subunit SecE [Desulfobacteraceae bacterium]